MLGWLLAETVASGLPLREYAETVASWPVLHLGSNLRRKGERYLSPHRPAGPAVAASVDPSVSFASATAR